MSKTLVLEISDEVYSSVERRVQQKGSTPEIFVIESIVKNLSNTEENMNKRSETEARNDLLRFAGAANSGNSRSADNEQIDSDLATEFGKDL
jgi:hypothetical protein